MEGALERLGRDELHPPGGFGWKLEQDGREQETLLVVSLELRVRRRGQDDNLVSRSC